MAQSKWPLCPLDPGVDTNAGHGSIACIISYKLADLSRISLPVGPMAHNNGPFKVKPNLPIHYSHVICPWNEKIMISPERVKVFPTYLGVGMRSSGPKRPTQNRTKIVISVTIMCPKIS